VSQHPVGCRNSSAPITNRRRGSESTRPHAHTLHVLFAERRLVEVGVNPASNAGSVWLFVQLAAQNATVLFEAQTGHLSLPVTPSVGMQRLARAPLLEPRQEDPGATHRILRVGSAELQKQVRLARNGEGVLGLFTSSSVVAVTRDGFGTHNSVCQCSCPPTKGLGQPSGPANVSPTVAFMNQGGCLLPCRRLQTHPVLAVGSHAVEAQVGHVVLQRRQWLRLDLAQRLEHLANERRARLASALCRSSPAAGPPRDKVFLWLTSSKRCVLGETPIFAYSAAECRCAVYRNGLGVVGLWQSGPISSFRHAG